MAPVLGAYNAESARRSRLAGWALTTPSRRDGAVSPGGPRVSRMAKSPSGSPARRLRLAGEPGMDFAIWHFWVWFVATNHTQKCQMAKSIPGSPARRSRLAGEPDGDFAIRLTRGPPGETAPSRRLGVVRAHPARRLRLADSAL